MLTKTDICFLTLPLEHEFTIALKDIVQVEGSERRPLGLGISVEELMTITYKDGIEEAKITFHTDEPGMLKKAIDDQIMAATAIA